MLSVKIRRHSGVALARPGEELVQERAPRVAQARVDVPVAEAVAHAGR